MATITETPSDALRYRTVELFDTETYPIDAPESPGYAALLAKARNGLEQVNCAQLSTFIRPEIVTRMQSEAEELAPTATYTKADLNPYFTEPPEGTPEGHPLRRFSPRRHGMVRADHFPRDGVIWSIFQNADLCRFVAAALGYAQLYTYRDPYGSVNINVQPEGCEFAWHFDNNEFTVSFGLDQSPEGGAFEYVPDLRTPEDENYDGVKSVLDGERGEVRSLKLRPGDLQLFKGGYTLHRVTAPKGGGRKSLLLSYVTDPANITSAEKARRIWGAVHPMHLERETARAG